MSANRVNARVLAVSSNEMKGSKKQGPGKPKVQAGDTVEDTEDTAFYSVELEACPQKGGKGHVRGHEKVDQIDARHTKSNFCMVEDTQKLPRKLLKVSA